MVNIFAFFVEPSSYTLDLIENVHEKSNVEYIFLKENSLARREVPKAFNFMGRMGTLKQVLYVYSVFKKNQIIIFNGYIHWQFVMLFLLNMIAFKKRIIAIESDTKFLNKKGLKGWIKRKYLGTIFQKKYILGFAGGSGIHKDLFRNYGMEERNIFLMPLMVNNDFFMNLEKRDSSQFSFLFVGRIVPIKNIEFLIHSFLKNFKNNTSVSLKIVGNGELETFLKLKFANEENIIFRGAKFGEDLVKEYHTSDIFVLPSKFEPWGLVVNEAMAAGLPVISSSEVGSNYDLIVNKNTGYVFEISEEDDLSKKMFQLYKNNDIYEIFSNNALGLMKNYWNYDLYEKNLMSAINRANKILYTINSES